MDDFIGSPGRAFADIADQQGGAEDQSFGAISRITASFDRPVNRGYSFGGGSVSRVSVTPTRASNEKPQVEEEELLTPVDRQEKNCFDD